MGQAKAPPMAQQVEGGFGVPPSLQEWMQRLEGEGEREGEGGSPTTCVF